jgi:hypothetical protein
LRVRVDEKILRLHDRSLRLVVLRLSNFLALPQPLNQVCTDPVPPEYPPRCAVGLAVFVRIREGR